MQTLQILVGNENIPGKAPASLTNRLQACLLQMREVDGFIAGVVSRADGLVIQHTLQSAQEAATLCALAVATVGSSRATASRLGLGGFDHGFLVCDGGVLLLTGAGREAVLACLLDTKSNLGMAKIIMARVAGMVETILAEA